MKIPTLETTSLNKNVSKINGTHFYITDREHGQGGFRVRHAPSDTHAMNGNFDYTVPRVFGTHTQIAFWNESK